MNLEDKADFIYKGRQYFGSEFYDLYNCCHCHTTITNEYLEEHYFNCKKYISEPALIRINRECYEDEL